MSEWKWLELAFFLSFFSFCPHPQSVLPRKQGVSCFKHLQTVMSQQLVSVQQSYCKRIKKTGQSWRCTANLPCRVGEHFTWKKRSYVPAEIDRTVLLWSQRLAWQSRRHGQSSQMLRRLGSVESAGLRWIHQRSHAASLPMTGGSHARVQRCGCRASEPGSSSCWPSLGDGGLPLYPLCLPFLHSHRARLSFLRRPRKGKWRSKENSTSLLVSILLHPASSCFRTAGRERPPSSTLSLRCALGFHPGKLCRPKPAPSLKAITSGALRLWTRPGGK